MLGEWRVQRSDPAVSRGKTGTSQRGAQLEKVMRCKEVPVSQGHA